jgi:DnaJ-class molecular chaperone
MAWNWKTALGVAADSASVPGGALAAPPVVSASRDAPEITRACGVAPGDSPRSVGMVWRPRNGGGSAPAGDPSGMLLHAEERPCVFCGGRGKASGGLCPVCNGKGSVHVQPPAVACAFCKGRGKMPPNSNLTCWVCNGKGVVAVSPPIELCPDCHGKGRRPCESLPCPRCRGIGVIGCPG